MKTYGYWFKRNPSAAIICPLCGLPEDDAYPDRERCHCWDHHCPECGHPEGCHLKTCSKFEEGETR